MFTEYALKIDPDMFMHPAAQAEAKQSTMKDQPCWALPRLRLPSSATVAQCAPGLAA
jgi:hypothetical protein